jgi:alpha-amylase/alpha-mannosidase (GH57 family)
MERYVCIHGHFYQPPRENPWLETVEREESAQPYHDWNERITAECYAPNAASRILAPDGRILRILNNYAHISFNFGPTLLAWMERHDPDTYQAVLRADAESRERFGKGSAMAMAYNHPILPLCNTRDKRTQVRWGIADFRHRFGRDPEGLWLPETAVDLETLEILAEHGIRFTILAPHQAAAVRAPGEDAWRDVRGGRIDPRQAYRLSLPSGAAICLFFYDAPIARAVAFEGLLERGEDLAGRLLTSLADPAPPAPLAHIADDGETYGHHHRFGDMALSYALHLIASGDEARLTNYASYLEAHPPTWEVQILENTSWSCAHGLERWRSDCGCSSGFHPDWNQAWRAPLREALDAARDAFAPLYEQAAGRLLRDPWAARDDYVWVLLRRTPEAREEFLARHARGRLEPGQRVRVWKLLEAQRHALLMYTSCGWFFDDISGLEATQILRYAARFLELAREATGQDLEPRFLEILQAARSNLPRWGDGRQVYQRAAKAAAVDLRRVAAHSLILDLFDPGAEECTRHGHRVRMRILRDEEASGRRLRVSEVEVTSLATEETRRFLGAVYHGGGTRLLVGVREADGARDAPLLEGSLGSDEEIQERLRTSYGGELLSFPSLFKDDRARVLQGILRPTVEALEDQVCRVHDDHRELMSRLHEMGIPLPPILQDVTRQVLRLRLERALATDPVALEDIEALLREAEELEIPLEITGLDLAFQAGLERLSRQWREAPLETTRLERLIRLARLIPGLPFSVNLWRVQNDVFLIVQEFWPEQSRRASAGEPAARKWSTLVGELGQTLGLRLEPDPS